MGYIYIIKNNINSNVYIGQTIRGIYTRFREHILAAENKKYTTSKLYNAIRELCASNFYVEMLEECDDSELDELEIQYISQYDSYNNGYNSTTGGKQYKTKSTEIEFVDDLVLDYKNGTSYKNLAIKYNISLNFVNKILTLNNSLIKNRHTETSSSSSYKKEILMLDKYFVPIAVFDSIRSVADWLQKNTKYSASYFNAYTYVSAACQKGNIAYGYRWQLFEDLTLENEQKVFRTKFEKEAYLSGAEAYQPEGQKYWVVDGVINKLLPKVQICIDCGRKITRNCTRCRECLNKLKTSSNKKILSYCKQCNKPIYTHVVNGLCSSCSSVQALGKIPKPSKEKLKQLLDHGYSVKSIAEIYGRTGSTISTWKKQYNL